MRPIPALVFVAATVAIRALAANCADARDLKLTVSEITIQNGRFDTVGKSGAHKSGPCQKVIDLRGATEAMHLFTSENGWYTHEGDRTIEPGKFGDLVVLSDDYFDPRKVSDEGIKRIHSVLTVVDGKVVHDERKAGQ